MLTTQEPAIANEHGVLDKTKIRFGKVNECNFGVWNSKEWKQ